MKNNILILPFIFTMLSGCVSSINPEYEPFLAEGTTTERVYNLSDASDTNICRLADLVDKRMRSGQIRKSISKGVEEEIKARDLDCSKPFPQYERNQSAKEDENDLIEWFEELIDGIN